MLKARVALDTAKVPAQKKSTVLALLKIEAEGSPGKRRPLNLGVVLDRSGSMQGAKIENVREATKALADQGAELRVGHRQQVENAGFGERSVRAGAAVGGKAQVIGVSRLHDAGIARAEEASHFAERRALGNQRLDERLRLGAGLAPQDALAGANYTTELDHGGDYGR